MSRFSFKQAHITYLFSGTFGGCAKWQDPHFHTRKYAQRNAPFIQITQRRRTHDYVDVNDNEKQMLNILNDFHSSFRSLMQTHQSYGWNVRTLFLLLLIRIIDNTRQRIPRSAS
jgi:hypothetical protein